MSDRYPFTGDKTLITHDGAVVWSEQVAVQSTLDFSNATDSTLTDSMNESYATAVEDNETQYLSVLETTGDITLEDLQNLTLGISKIGTQEVLEYTNENVENVDANGDNIGDQQVVVFSLDGSDDLYGIQITQDEEGNVQKYQFKFRTTDDGQLEAIPESIELLPNDEEDDNENPANVDEVLVQEIETDETEAQETSIYFSGDVQDDGMQETQVYIQQDEETAKEYVEFQQEDENYKVYIKGETNSPDYSCQNDCEYEEGQEEHIEGDEGLSYQDAETEVPQEEHYEEIVDVKAGILEESMALRNAATNIKHELLQEDTQEAITYNEDSQDYAQYENNEPADDNTINEEPLEDCSAQDENYATVEIEGTHETVLQYQQYVPGDVQQVYEASDAVGHNLQQRNLYEHVFIQDRMPVDKSSEINASEEVEEKFVTEVGVENDSDNDDYQIVEGLHITAEGDIDSPSPVQEPETILQEVIEKPPVPERANILKQTSLLKPIKEIKPKINKTVVYYVVPHLEKENVNSLPINNTTSYRPIRSNPRTVLKSSFPELKEPEVKTTLADERLNKRFARSKEAVQARLFNNFISKTTIPHAPVRQTRLPRKQLIKPVDTRRNEEIIVQEVMVSSKGFIENVEEKLRNKDKLEVTGYVVLTDSDDDYDPKPGNKKKKKHKKHRKPDADDTDSDISIIEIHSDDEPLDDMQRENKESPKRGRGRPKKSPEIECVDGAKRRRGRPPKSGGDQEESPTKKSRTESDEEPAKKEIKCPHCTKTFPSQNSLATHIQHHNLENSLRNKVALPAIEYRHKCDKCQATFKNTILLKRHVCEEQAPKTRTRFECTLCKKSFSTVQALNIHKRSHVKENLVNATSVTRVTPKKPSTSRLFKSPKRVEAPRAVHKCNECSRVCYSQESLALHQKTHRKFVCGSCKTTFPSRLLLDAHVRVSCVKMASPSNRRLSFKIRKSFVQSPRRKSVWLGRGSVRPSLGGAAVGLNSTLDPKFECSLCGEKFQTFQNKFQHQAKVHGKESHDKSILAEQKRIHTPKSVYGGIPARYNMRNTFSSIKTKVALVTPTKGAN